MPQNMILHIRAVSWSGLEESATFTLPGPPSTLNPISTLLPSSDQTLTLPFHSSCRISFHLILLLLLPPAFLPPSFLLCSLPLSLLHHRLASFPSSHASRFFFLQDYNILQKEIYCVVLVLSFNIVSFFLILYIVYSLLITSFLPPLPAFPPLVASTRFYALTPPTFF